MSCILPDREGDAHMLISERTFTNADSPPPPEPSTGHRNRNRRLAEDVIVVSASFRAFPNPNLYLTGHFRVVRPFCGAPP